MGIDTINFPEPPVYVTHYETAPPTPAQIDARWERMLAEGQVTPEEYERHMTDPEFDPEYDGWARAPIVDGE